ncbi:MAG: phosphoserine phosphatase SerB [Rhodoglobus sp.]
MPSFLVVLDVDSTLIEDEVIELLAAQAGTHAEVAQITLKAMNGELDFEESLLARVATLAGLPHSVFDTVRAQVRITTGAADMVDAIHTAQGRVGVVSGGFHEVIDPLADKLSIDYCRANRLEVIGGILTGRLIGPIIDAEAKATSLKEWAAEFDVPLSRTVAVGDGANDLRMMECAGLSVGFDAKASVRERASVLIDVRDLRQVLPLLGLGSTHNRRS